MSRTINIFKTEKNENLETAKSKGVFENAVLCCRRCTVFYEEYEQLVAHLYWRHGTEGSCCNTCGLKQWRYAPHVCHVLPINDSGDETASAQEERESEYCCCGLFLEDSPMIGCDGPRCPLQWYHFKCVGIVAAPEGDWFCPHCSTNKPANSEKERSQTVKT